MFIYGKGREGPVTSMEQSCAGEALVFGQSSKNAIKSDSDLTYLDSQSHAGGT